MSVFLIGAMPWVRLYDGERLTGWASVADVHWSTHGSGRFLSLRLDGRRRLFGTNRDLAEWLDGWYFRHVDEGYQPEPFQSCDVEIVIDAGTGLRASAGGVAIEMSEPIDRQLIRRERYPLGDFTPTASWVRISCARAGIVVDGEHLPGQVTVAEDSYGPRSSAQINVAEVWSG